MAKKPKGKRVPPGIRQAHDAIEAFRKALAGSGFRVRDVSGEGTFVTMVGDGTALIELEPDVCNCSACQRRAAEAATRAQEQTQ